MTVDEPRDVRQGEELDRERLTAYLDEALDEPLADLRILQFPSGFSNLTYLLRGSARELVLRRPPFGSKVRSAHDMGREARVLKALEEVYDRVPRVVARCEDEAVLGAPFYVMERVRGTILRAGWKTEVYPGPREMHLAGRALVETLAELHAVDWRAAGLADLGRPERYVRRQVEGWIDRYERARTDEVEEMEVVGRWLRDHLPAERPGALVHNDFKYDNLVYDPADFWKVIAVLDWEMATLGDPLMDLGTTLGYWLDPADPPELRALGLSPTTVPGNPTRSEVAQLYAEGTGADLSDLVFYYAQGLYKIAVIVQQIYARYRAGATRDSRFARLNEAVRGCSLMAAQAIHHRRIDRLFPT